MVLNKVRKNNFGVSAVIGVILMVAVTVAIAATAYVYLDYVINTYDDKSSYDIFVGYFESIKSVDTGYSWDNQYLVVSNNSIYLTEFEESKFYDVNYLSTFINHNVSIVVKELSYNFPDCPRYRLMDITALSDDIKPRGLVDDWDIILPWVVVGVN
jgi:hypothetical protein